MVARRTLHVLLIEDNPGDARLVREWLREAEPDEFPLTHVSTLGDGLAHLAGPADVDLVLVDLSLPDESGLDTVRRVVKGAGSAIIVVMTGADDEELGISAVKEGAQEYLIKGTVDGAQFRRQLRFAAERQENFRTELERDELTTLHNRRGFFALAERHMVTACRNGHGFVLLFMDLDGLKPINDQFGHTEGNRALVEAAEILKRSFRQSDIVGRLGGDEFAALAQGSAESSEDKLRARLAAELAAVNAQPDRSYALGFSMGVVVCPPDETRSIDELLAVADERMYADKRARRAGRARSA
ncbi:MAG TPA: diguanylate cyclase [Vicinamibacterales bacterium]|nr:diguanylate cyclase [Vicinamibacterales bacterium]